MLSRREKILRKNQEKILGIKNMYPITIIPATQEAETAKSQYKASMGKKFRRLHLNNRKLDVVVSACHSSYVGS
jgi:hypothetical protein